MRLKHLFSVLFVLLLTYCGLLTYFFVAYSQTSLTMTPATLWNRKLVDKYSDEPKFKDDKYQKITSASAWIIPPNPQVISQNYYAFQYQQMSQDEKDKVNEHWKSWYSQNPQKLFEKFHLSPKVRNSLFYREILPFNTTTDAITKVV